MLREVARLVSREVRETDLLRRPTDGQLSVVLLDADLNNSMQVIDRLVARFEHYEFDDPGRRRSRRRVLPDSRRRCGHAPAGRRDPPRSPAPRRPRQCFERSIEDVAMKTSISCSLLLLLSTLPAMAQTPPAAPSRPASQPVGTSGTPRQPSPPGHAVDRRPPVDSASRTVGTPAARHDGPATRDDATAPQRLPPTTAWCRATSCASRSTRTRSCRRACRSGPTARSRCRSPTTSPRPGTTPSELRDAIVTSLKDYITNPTVTVMVVETVPPLIYVMGEVNSAGPHPLVGKMDVLQALATAGGFTDFANTKNIVIRRGSQVLTFNYNDAVKGKAAPVYLQPGDTIVVK